MSAKHTPGPWTVYDPEMPDTEETYGIDGPSCQPVVYFGLTQNDGINRLEDARLIAAAPELLKALCMARAKIAAELQVMAMCHTAPDGMIDDAEMVLLIEAEQDLLNQIDAAIFKAIG